MAGVLLSSFPPFFFLVFGVIEIFLFQYYTKYNFSSLKTFKNNITTTLSNIISSNTQTTFILVWHYMSYICFKLNSIEFQNSFMLYNVMSVILFFFLFFLFIITKNSLNNSKYSYQPLIFTLIFLTYLLGLITEYISFLLIVETVTTLYFFFFLKYSYSNLISVLKYKNLISYYLWLSFFTLLFIVLNTLQWVYMFGTLNFSELSFFLQSKGVIIFIFLSFFWKLGVPGFHFFKLELYKYLELLPLIIFSTISLVINTFLLIYLMYTLGFIINYKLSIFSLVLLTNILLLLQGIDKIYFFYFFAISSINTWAFFFLISIA